jgi:hypothetical protein
MKTYQNPELEMINFSTNDIITTSGNPDELPDDNWGNADELPDDEWVFISSNSYTIIGGKKK